MYDLGSVNLRALKIFLDVFDAQNFSVVARREGISASQSTPEILPDKSKPLVRRYLSVILSLRGWFELMRPCSSGSDILRHGLRVYLNVIRAC